MKYTNYLFDLDGVLVNTDHIQYKTTIDAVYEILNYDVASNIELDVIFKSTIFTLDKLYSLSNYTDINEEIINKIYTKKKQLADSYFSKLDTDYEKIELMEYLKKNNCKIAVVTNSNKTSANIMLKNIGIYDFIDVIITNEDITNKKPHPEPYLKAIEMLNVEKESCIIFEDSEVGLISAKKTGCNYYHVQNYLDVNIDLINNINYNL